MYCLLILQIIKYNSKNQKIKLAFGMIDFRITLKTMFYPICRIKIRILQIRVPGGSHSGKKQNIRIKWTQNWQIFNNIYLICWTWGWLCSTFLTHRQGRLQPRVSDFLGAPKYLDSKKNQLKQQPFRRKRKPQFFFFSNFFILILGSSFLCI